MGLSRRRLTRGVQAGRPSASGNGASVAEVARAFEVNANFLHRWQREFRERPGNAFPGAGRRRWDEGRLAQLEGKMGQQALEIDFLKGCFRRIDEQRKLQAVTEKPLCLPADPDPKGRSRSLDRETHVGFGGRDPGAFVSLSAPLAGAGPDLEVRDTIQRIAAEFPSYGWPRMTAELKRRGWAVNRKHVYRLLREDNLLYPRQQKFLVTTDSDQGRVAHARVAAASGVRRLLADYWRLVGAPTSQRRRRRLWRGQRVWSDGAAPNAGETGALSGGAGQSAVLPRGRRAGGSVAAASRDGSSSSSPCWP